MKKQHSVSLATLTAVAAGLAVVVFMGGAATAEDFVSYAGKYKVTFPANWRHVDYTTADLYIRGAGGDLDYETVFTCTDDSTVFGGRYIIITLDSTSELSLEQRDSTVAAIAGDLGKELTHLDATGFLHQPLGEAAAYCPELRTFAVLSVADAGTPQERMNILAVRFFERGTVYFFLYSPEATMPAAQTDLLSVLTSFTSSDLSVQSNEPVQVADIKDDDKKANPTPFIGGFVVIIMAVIVIARKRRASKSN